MARDYDPHSCIHISLCDSPRESGSPFCKKHKGQHAASLWRKAWLEYQEQLKTNKNTAVWSPPPKKEKDV